MLCSLNESKTEIVTYRYVYKKYVSLVEFVWVQKAPKKARKTFFRAMQPHLRLFIVQVIMSTFENIFLLLWYCCILKLMCISKTGCRHNIVFLRPQTCSSSENIFSHLDMWILVHEAILHFVIVCNSLELFVNVLFRWTLKIHENLQPFSNFAYCIFINYTRINVIKCS